jgi:hypothetical protein
MPTYYLLTLFLLFINIQNKQLTHLQTSYNTCCPDTYILNTTLLQCVCPPERPHLTKDKKCIACDPPSFWNDNITACTLCPQNSYYN